METTSKQLTPPLIEKLSSFLQELRFVPLGLRYAPNGASSTVYDYRAFTGGAF